GVGGEGVGGGGGDGWGRVVRGAGRRLGRRDAEEQGPATRGLAVVADRHGVWANPYVDRLQRGALLSRHTPSARQRQPEQYSASREVTGSTHHSLLYCRVAFRLRASSTAAPAPTSAAATVNGSVRSSVAPVSRLGKKTARRVCAHG